MIVKIEIPDDDVTDLAAGLGYSVNIGVDDKGDAIPNPVSAETHVESACVNYPETVLKSFRANAAAAVARDVELNKAVRVLKG